MEVHFTPEQEAQLAQMASREGTDAAELVKDAALRLLEKTPRLPANGSELPSLRLGSMSSLHRRDLYNDVG
ncbi:MAG: hypothetical protein WCC25_15345 [Candidatus Korobacteraceae bacterium]